MYLKLYDFFPSEQIKLNVAMKEFTTFKIGGPADVMIIPRTISDIIKAVNFCRNHNIPAVMLGMGSNILVKDKGIRGIVIKIGDSLKNYSIAGNEIYAEAGISLSELSRKAAENSLSGLEFAEGIPGSLGGAVVMNAGAYNGEIKDVLKEVLAVDYSGRLKTFNTQQMQFGYRKSIFQSMEFIVLAIRMQLKKGNKEQIFSTMQEFNRLRREKQPLDMPSAGSTFRRPEGFYVGPLIEELGLKGFKIGGAEVSTKHAGFIVNSGNATASDIIELITYIQEKANKKYGVSLVPEIRIIGED
jgi:UDP-N-acetylmuramate dehydrogenase